MSQQILEDLEEADFYMQQNLLEEAEAIYQRLLEVAPNHPRVLVRLGEIAAARGEDPSASGSARAPAREAAPAPSDARVMMDSAVQSLLDDEIGERVEIAAARPEPGAPSAPPDAALDEVGVSDLDLDLSHEGLDVDAELDAEDSGLPAGLDAADEPAPSSRVAEAADLGSGDFDLAAELSDALDGDAPGGSSGPLSDTADDGFAAVFQDFKKGVSASLSEGDHEAHYDLGIAYREMGLVDDAMAEFRLSMQSAERRVDSLHMLGLCAMAQDRPNDAVIQFQQALSTPDITREQQLAVRFELGRAFEGVGDRQRARETYERVAAIDPLFCAVEECLERLDDARKLEGGEGGEGAGFESFEDVIAEANAPDPQTRGDVLENFDDLRDDVEETPPPDTGKRRRRKRKISFL